MEEENKNKSIGGANHSIWINTAAFDQFKTNSRIQHKKSASERIEAFVIAENIKDNGEDASIDYSTQLEDQTISELRTCEIEIGKLRKIFSYDRSAFDRVLDIAVSLGVRVSGRDKDKTIMLSEVDDVLMCKLYEFEVTGNSEYWDYLLQYTEELRKKAKLKKTLRELKAKKLSDKPK
jgi:hypothetical protein